MSKVMTEGREVKISRRWCILLEPAFHHLKKGVHWPLLFERCPTEISRVVGRMLFAAVVSGVAKIIPQGTMDHLHSAKRNSGKGHDQQWEKHWIHFMVTLRDK